MKVKKLSMISKIILIATYLTKQATQVHSEKKELHSWYNSIGWAGLVSSLIGVWGGVSLFAQAHC